VIENRTMPSATVMPVLVYDDVGAACEWLCRVFGFAERWRAGDHRAQLSYGDGAVVVGEARTGGAGKPGEGLRYTPEEPGRLSHSVLVRIEHVDVHYERARDCGAAILDSPRDYPYGERQYSATDLGGHHWTFTESIADVAPEDWGGVSGPVLGGPRSNGESGYGSIAP
jgi:uncharacterized glyoxalase superfamily protein PhnB